MTRNQVDIYARGKVLLTGEYAVLAGATALAFPARRGQQLRVLPDNQSNTLYWESLDPDGKWFSAELSLQPLDLLATSDANTAQRLLTLLVEIQHLSPGFLDCKNGWKVITKADFPRGWGLGTSSTLIHLLARWAEINPYTLLERTLGGSGYDVACAGAEHPILYRRTTQGPEIREVSFRPAYLDQLYLVYSGRKQSTAEELLQYSAGSIPAGVLEEVSSLSLQILEAPTMKEFRYYIDVHENLISRLLKRDVIKKQRFSDYPGTIKSLGAWGGDLLLFVWDDDPVALLEYLRRHDLNTLIPFRELLLTD
ncbi:MAG TPA: GYDIA family GHMP kinase [Bacteroidales bacterium]|nr:GYDIA family GHMP kinase [Bacteroidales bacterium]